MGDPTQPHGYCIYSVAVSDANDKLQLNAGKEILSLGNVHFFEIFPDTEDPVAKDIPEPQSFT